MTHIDAPDEAQQPDILLEQARAIVAKIRPGIVWDELDRKMPFVSGYMCRHDDLRREFAIAVARQVLALTAAEPVQASATPSSKDAGGEPVGEIVANHPVHGWHMKALKPWDEIGAGTKLYAAAAPSDAVIRKAAIYTEGEWYVPMRMVSAGAAAPSDTRALCMLAAEAAHRNATGGKAMPADQIRAIVDEVLSAGAAAKTEQAPTNGPALANAIAAIDRGEDDDGPETPGIWTKEEVLDMLEHEIVTDTGAATLRNGDEMKFNLTDLALLANRAAFLTRQASAAGAGSEQLERALFEKYVAESSPVIKPKWNNETGEYMGCWSQDAWSVWKARAALARAPLPAQDHGQSVDDARDAARREAWLIANPRWSVRWRIHTKKQIEQWQMVDDGEPWGQWGEYRKVIYAAMSASRPDDKGGAILAQLAVDESEGGHHD